MALDSEVLLLDDLGAHRVTDWVQDTVTSIVTHRCNNQKPLIATTNLARCRCRQQHDHQKTRRRRRISPHACATTSGDRARSRLFEMCTVIRMPIHRRLPHPKRQGVLKRLAALFLLALAALPAYGRRLLAGGRVSLLPLPANAVGARIGLAQEHRRADRRVLHSRRTIIRPQPGEFDLTGRTSPRRDLVGFVRLLRKLGMRGVGAPAAARPGPGQSCGSTPRSSAPG